MTVAAPARQLSATPSFAGLIACATPGCGTVLSQYNPDPDRLCAVCRRKRDNEPQRSCEGIDLERLVAGLLLIHDARHPGEPVNLTAEMAALGVDVDSQQVQLIVRHIARRHGIIAHGERLKTGYRLEAWEVRYKPAIGCAGVLMDRGSDGRFAGVASLLQQSQGSGEVADPQPQLFEPEELGSEG